MRANLVVRYILGEMIPTFFLGVIVFVFILLMFQALRLTEFVLVHGVKLSTVAQMTAYMSTSFLPALFPMSLLFAVLLTYSRLSADSEIVALRSIGLSMSSIVSPALVLGLLVGVLSLQTSYHLAPWGNRQFELIITEAGATKPGVTLREGTFAEGFFELVVYANKVDSKKGILHQVFIYDERDSRNPITVIAKKGVLSQDPEHPGHQASLRLLDGSIHRTAQGRHTKIDFATYEIFLSDPIEKKFRDKSPQSLTIDDIQAQLKDPERPPESIRELNTEFHKRTALAFACILFALIGVGLGTVTNRRNARSSGAVICLGLIVTYYVIHIAAEGASRKGYLPPQFAMWIANAVFSVAAAWSLKRSWT